MPDPGERLHSLLASCPVAVRGRPAALRLLPIGQSPAPGCGRWRRFGQSNVTHDLVPKEHLVLVSDWAAALEQKVGHYHGVPPAEPVFSAAWDNAVQTSFNRVEGKLYSIAMKGDGDREACMDILKHRRSDQWHINNNGDRVSGSQTNYFLNMPMQEHIERLERLGLPVARSRAACDLLLTPPCWARSLVKRSTSQ